MNLENTGAYSVCNPVASTGAVQRHGVTAKRHLRRRCCGEARGGNTALLTRDLGSESTYATAASFCVPSLFCACSTSKQE